jgi:hypothetical protein
MKLKAIAFLAALVACTAFQAQDGWARERGGDKDAEKNALEGKAPPIKLEMDAWVNGPEKTPTWENLKGKIVVLDFWAYW